MRARGEAIGDRHLSPVILIHILARGGISPCGLFSFLRRTVTSLRVRTNGVKIDGGPIRYPIPTSGDISLRACAGNLTMDKNVRRADGVSNTYIIPLEGSEALWVETISSWHPGARSRVWCAFCAYPLFIPASGGCIRMGPLREVAGQNRL